MIEIESSAPGRCGIVGNPSDMYGGSVVSCTTQERAHCKLSKYSGGIHLLNGDDSRVLSTKEERVFKGDKLDIAVAALLYFEIDPASAEFQLELRTDIPMRAGLAGSTAMLATLVGVFDALLQLKFSLYHFAETTRKIEARVMGITCGFQDQHMAIFGGLNFMSFAGKESLEQRDEEPLGVIEPLASFAEHPPLLLAHTGVQHNSSAVHSSPRQRWLAGDIQVRRNYARIAELSILAKRAVVEQNWREIGGLMNENHALVAELGGSGPDNERLIQAALQAGAWGAKLAGAGGGGTIITLTDDPEKLGAALESAGADGLYAPMPQPGLTVA